MQDNLESTKTALNKIVDDMKREGNSNVSGTEAAVKTLNGKLNQIIEVANTVSGAIGDPSDELLGNVAPHTSDTGRGSKGDNVDKLVKGIKDIVGVVLGAKEGNPAAGDNKKASDGNTGRTGGNATDGEAGKLFATDNAGANANAKIAAADAAKAVGAVSGADILQAIFQGDGGGAYKLANSQDDDRSNTQKDAVIAGAVALRADG